MQQATNIKGYAADLAAAGHDDLHRTGRLARQQAIADDEVRRRALGSVWADPRRRRPGRLASTSGHPSAAPRGRRFLLAGFLFQIPPKVFPTGKHGVPDQARIPRSHRRLAVIDRFPIDRIADHLGERGDAWIFGDEAVVPALVSRARSASVRTCPARRCGRRAVRTPGRFRAHRPRRPPRRSPCGRRDRPPRARSRTRLSMWIGPGRSLALNCANTSLVGSMWPMKNFPRECCGLQPY